MRICEIEHYARSVGLVKPTTRGPATHSRVVVGLNSERRAASHPRRFRERVMTGSMRLLAGSVILLALFASAGFGQDDDYAARQAASRGLEGFEGGHRGCGQAFWNAIEAGQYGLAALILFLCALAAAASSRP
jgi:hypothetical protein